MGTLLQGGPSQFDNPIVVAGGGIRRPILLNKLYVVYCMLKKITIPFTTLTLKEAKAYSFAMGKTN